MYSFVVPLIVIGDCNVGKTSFITKFIEDGCENPPITTFTEVSSKIIELESATKVKVQICDTSGQEKYRSIATSYYRHAAGVFIFFSITDKTSFMNAKVWLNEVQEKAPRSVLIFLIGNKLDLEEKREVSTEEAKYFAESNDLTYYELSCKDSKEVEQTVKDMVNQTIECKNDDPTIHVIKNNDLSNDDIEDINLSCESVISRCWFFWK